MMLHRSVMQELDVELRRHHGLAVTEFDVLITLFNAPDIASACLSWRSGSCSARPGRLTS